MVKMVNQNTINDMTLVNAKSQAKMTQLIQKIGKGKRRVKVTLSKSTRSYLIKMLEEMKKQMAVYEKQLPNLFQFFNYLEKEARIVKQNKKQKTKDIVLSYEELDFLKIQIKETIKGIDNLKSSLKWYNLVKKGLYKTLKKQNEITLEELGKTSVNK
ncbi:MAG: viral A-type inclusion protein [Leptotrichiaceae bacterium]|nr:viral A-type inclusion protein [Leptotrichiaceae bacterium]MBP6281900.1 viral A-type inclusion protein [Leptotrichiaceae bacterium]MBP7100131.1 viral A-type inclusion protein [Leptotrichiaceae bacterium]MBP7739842.1 viral A-type inclusion protein [Leptotrichiaceae bacterium]MBP9630489.1 viral A-type inclusion protein [Leptotrichiaceae bacterium]